MNFVTKRRVGLLVPSSNTVAEVDFGRSLPPGLTLHTARMFLPETTAEAEQQMLTRYLPQAVADIASLRPHVVVFACTSAGALLGTRGEEQLVAQIEQTAGAPVVSTNAAVSACIVGYRPRRVAVITPYIPELDQYIQQSLEARGLQVARIAGMGLTENPAIAAVRPSEIVAFATTQLAGVAFDLLFVSCTNFRGVEARAALSDRFRVPVVTSNQATIEATLHMLGLARGKSGFD